jgi:uncharacterized membrane protein
LTPVTPAAPARRYDALMTLELLLVAAGLAVALAMTPWRTLRASGLQNPWLACLVLLPWMWAAQRALPGGVVLQMSGACLLVLMFGWPLAVVSLMPIAAAGAWLADASWQQGIALAFWNGVLPATLALLIGLATRRWLPRHLFVYILGRGFFATAIAAGVAGAVSAAVHGLPAGLQVSDLALGRGLAASGDAVITGMLVAVFVAYRPGWLATYSDRLYLPPAQAGRDDRAA